MVISSVRKPLGEYRYEIKYSLKDYDFLEIQDIILSNRFFFSEIYHQRQINNIYYDFGDLSNLQDHLAGVNERYKIRIRWYGELFQRVQKPKLEFKIKVGRLGTKESYLQEPFEFFSLDDGYKIIPEKDFKIGDNLLETVVPTLVNSYQRKYYISQCSSVRITIDHDLDYYNLSKKQRIRSRDSVIEVKFAQADEEKGRAVCSSLPFCLTNYSKYLTGMFES